MFVSLSSFYLFLVCYNLCIKIFINICRRPFFFLHQFIPHSLPPFHSKKIKKIMLCGAIINNTSQHMGICLPHFINRHSMGYIAQTQYRESCKKIPSGKFFSDRPYFTYEVFYTCTFNSIQILLYSIVALQLWELFFSYY